MARSILIIMVSILALSSCRTSSAETFSAEQYDHALHLVLDQAQSKATTDLFKQFNEFREPMIPKQYSAIERLRDDIPGMDYLITQWSEASTIFILQVYGQFTDYAETLKNSISFHDPKALLEEGEYSISNLFSSLYREDIARVISRSIRDMDFTLWHRTLVQYNAWASSRNMLFGENHELVDAEMEAQQLIDMFSYHLADLFFEHLADSESLIRTTPDLTMDPVEAQVLGLV
ncbi:MAG: hypothetical protein J5891_10080 [Spirochaetales bacterium]|nr:hypothetical protein [Spirochaetales bacterium]